VSTDLWPSPVAGDPRKEPVFGGSADREPQQRARWAEVLRAWLGFRDSRERRAPRAACSGTRAMSFALVRIADLLCELCISVPIDEKCLADCDYLRGELVEFIK
jgi:hypothetical protein